MKSYYLKYLLFFLLLIVPNAQQFTVSGTIYDSENKFPLSFGNVRILNSTTGTAANVSGEYLLNLTKGQYELVASYIGYKSDTVKIDLTSDMNLDFKLDQASVEFEPITVIPGVNPAIEIIEKAIKQKEERNLKLDSYIFDAYTKGKIKTTEEISSDGGSVGVGLGVSDSSELKITGIFENQSKGYFLKPDNYKEEIVARKQTANFPSSINILTGGRIIQNFYSDDIQFFGRPIVSPIADNALEHYYYYIEDTTAINNKKVFRIYFSVIDESNPGFYGRVFIADKTFELLQVDVNINSAANPGGIFNKVNVFQQFVPYENEIYMPIDYRLFVEGNFFGLIKFGFEIHSVLYDYKINKDLSEDDFGMLAVKVFSDADEKDNSYWDQIQTIPSSKEELSAYQRIDSLESIEKTFWDRFSFFAPTLNLDKNFYISGPLTLYHFNRVEGHSINFELGANQLFNKRFSSSLNLSYGFSDKKLKNELQLNYLLGEYRTTNISFNVFDKTESLFNESDNYNKLTSTLTSLFGKYDFRDYYSRSGFEFELSGEAAPILELSFGLKRLNDKHLTNNSNYSFFNTDKTYRENHPVWSASFTMVSLGFQFDFRKYIEDGTYRRRITENKSRFSFGGEYSLKANRGLVGNFEFYNFNVYSRINSLASTLMELWIDATIGSGSVPIQMMKALPGNIETVGKSRTFRTIGFGEVYGDRVITANFEYNFNDELWRLFSIPLLKNSQISLIYYLNAAYVDITEDSQRHMYMMDSPDKFLTPFYESGFSIGHPLIPLRLEFTWKLNHRGHNNFVFGINTFLL